MLRVRVKLASASNRDILKIGLLEQFENMFFAHLQHFATIIRFQTVVTQFPQTPPPPPQGPPSLTRPLGWGEWGILGMFVNSVELSKASFANSSTFHFGVLQQFKIP
jgi:hypothetical protein